MLDIGMPLIENQRPPIFEGVLPFNGKQPTILEDDQPQEVVEDQPRQSTLTLADGRQISVDACAELGKRVLEFTGLGKLDRHRTLLRATHDAQSLIQQCLKTALGLQEDGPFLNEPQDPVSLETMQALDSGMSLKKKNVLFSRLRGVSGKRKKRDLLVDNEDLVADVLEFVETEEVSMLSDRVNDSLNMAPEEEPTRFRYLKNSIHDSWMMITPTVDISEKSFREILKKHGRHIKKPSVRSETAVCQKCQQVKLYTEAIEQQMPSFEEKLGRFTDGKFSQATPWLEQMMCDPEDGGNHRDACLEGTCNDCKGLEFFLNRLDFESWDEEITDAAIGYVEITKEALQNPNSEPDPKIKSEPMSQSKLKKELKSQSQSTLESEKIKQKKVEIIFLDCAQLLKDLLKTAWTFMRENLVFKHIRDYASIRFPTCNEERRGSRG